MAGQIVPAEAAAIFHGVRDGREQEDSSGPFEIHTLFDSGADPTSRDGDSSSGVDISQRGTFLLPIRYG